MFDNLPDQQPCICPDCLLVQGAISRGGKSVGGKSAASHGERSAKHAKGSQHSGDRFKAKKKGTGKHC